MKTIKIGLVPTTRTDLMCIACGLFRAELQVIIPAGRDPFTGLHAKCAKDVHVRRKASPLNEHKSAATVTDPDEEDGTLSAIAWQDSIGKG